MRFTTHEFLMGDTSTRIAQLENAHITLIDMIKRSNGLLETFIKRNLRYEKNFIDKGAGNYRRRRRLREDYQAQMACSELQEVRH